MNHVTEHRSGLQIKYTSLAMAVLCIAVTSPDVNAQQSDTQTVTQMHSARLIDEVIVTARRREESSQSVPVAITALDSSALERGKIDDLNDLQKYVPSLNVSSSAGKPNAPVYSLRGIRPTEAIYGQDPTVAIYFADVVLSPAKGSNLGMFDLESVQVLKGPQGTLFGRNTTGGAILLTPRRPGEVFGGELTVGIGNHGSFEGEAALDLPVNDTLGFRISGRAIESDGYQTNVAPGPLYGDKFAGEKTRSLRLSSVWTPTDRLENHAIVNIDDNKTTGRMGVLESVNPNSSLGLYNGGPPLGLPSIFEALERAKGRDVHKVESDIRGRSDVKIWGVINTTTFDLNDQLQLKSIAAYREVKAKEDTLVDATAIPGILSSAQTATLDHASYEIQLQGQAFDDRLDWVTGFYWYYEDGMESSGGEVLKAINPASPSLQTAYITNHSYSLFGQATYEVTPSWSVTGGIRFNYDDKEMTLENTSGLGCVFRDQGGNPLPLDQCEVKLSKSFNQPTGSFSVEYKASDDWLIYVASRLGYRSGGFNVRAEQEIQFQPFDAETIIDLELGSKADWGLGNMGMRTNVSLYHQWYDEIQRTVTVTNSAGAPASTVSNAAEASVYGFEFDQVIMPTDDLTFIIGYAYVKPEYNGWENPANGQDLSRTPFFFTPEHSLTASINYSKPLEGDLGTLNLAASGAYQSKTWISAFLSSSEIAQMPNDVVESDLRQGDFWVFDASASLQNIKGSGLDIQAYIKNITNEEYVIGGIHLYHTLGLNMNVYNEPRSYGLRVKYSF